MTRVRLKRIGLNRRAMLAIVAGLLLATAFPRPGLAAMAWIAPGLLLLAGLGTRPGRAFRLGFSGGLAHFLASLYWLLFIPFPAGAIASWLALSAYCALYPALWLWLCCRLFPALGDSVKTQPRGPESESVTALSPLPPDWLRPLLRSTWMGRVAWALACGAIWVALEMTRGRFLTGFPWNPLGASQAQELALVQIASVTGIYGVSFVLVWVSAALLCCGLQIVSRFYTRPPLPKRFLSSPLPGSGMAGRFPGFGMFAPQAGPYADIALPLIGMTVILFHGVWQLAQPLPHERELRLALVQPSIPQKLIFDPAETTNRFNALMDLSRLALTSKPDLLVWPEDSLPGLDEENFRSMTRLIATSGVWMVFGAEDVVRNSRDGQPESYDHFNSAFLFDPQGRYVATYRKRQLVIFGEFVPFEDWFPLIKRLTPIEGSFTRGKSAVPFLLGDKNVRFSVLICFEDVFPNLVRKDVDDDLDFLLNLTNDGWFGESAAQWQQAANAGFRAVENGLPLVRCTNNGLTCWIDAHGRWHDVGLGDGTDVYGPGFKTVRLPLAAPGAKLSPTFYRTHGDWFARACVAWTSFLLVTRALPAIARERRLRSPQPA